jgi:hypothetical protein
MHALPVHARSWFAGVLFAGLLPAGFGCGDGKVRVRGTVSFDGKPVESGVISFDPADGQGPNTGAAITGGRFEMSGAAVATPGKKIVRIRASRPTGRKIESGPPAPPGTLVDELEAFIPAHYNEKSTLTAEILPGKVNEVAFNLLPAKKPPR